MGNWVRRQKLMGNHKGGGGGEEEPCPSKPAVCSVLQSFPQQFQEFFLGWRAAGHSCLKALGLKMPPRRFRLEI